MGRTTEVDIHQSRTGSLDVKVQPNSTIERCKTVACWDELQDKNISSQGGSLTDRHKQATGLTGRFVHSWEIIKPSGVDVDIRYITYLKFIRSLELSTAEESDTMVRKPFNDGLRQYLSGSKYFREWKAQQLVEFITPPEEETIFGFTDFGDTSNEDTPTSQSGEIRVGNADISEETNVEQTMEMHTDTPQVQLEMETVIDSTRLQASVKNTELGAFLSRPLRIGSHDINNGSYIDVAFNPWMDFLSNTAVQRKIENYSLIRGKLHVEFLINGGPYYFGNIMVGYKPRGNGYEFKNDTHTVVGTLNTAPVEEIIHRVMLNSQRPHIQLNPTTSTGGRLDLPFFHNKNYLDLIDATDVLDMGEIQMISMVNLERAIGANDTRPINVTVMAWMTEVELAGPTTRAIFSQSGSMGDDEYGTGIVSKPASAVAKFAGHLKKIPVIGPFATATQLAARGIGGIAHLFGFSQPVNLDPVVRYLLAPMGVLANSGGEATVDKLAFDAKQELTIDHNITGAKLPDEMTVKALTSKSAIVEYFQWSAQSTQDTLLGTINVMPTHTKSRWSNDDEYGVEWINNPLAHATWPFKYWRGGLEYRFQIQACDLHRGRLLIAYDPRGFSNNDLPDTNTVFTRIIDLEKTKDFTLPVYWFKDKSWARVSNGPTATNMAQSDGAVNFDPEECNGQIKIFVLNELTSPDEDFTGYVRIFCSLRGADDYQVAVPNDYLIKRTTFTGQVIQSAPLVVNNAWSQSGLLDSGKSAEEAKPGFEGSEMLEPIGTPSDADAMPLVYQGEIFESFRYMLKRYALNAVYARSHRVGNGGRSTRYRLTLPNFPFYNGRAEYRGMYDQVRDGGRSNIDYTISGRTLLNWLTPAYAARRGGLRAQYSLSTYSSTQFNGLLISRAQEGSHSPGTSEAILDTGNSNAHAAHSSVIETGFNGQAFSNANAKYKGVELPYYSDIKFEDASETNHENLVEGHCHHVDIFDGSRQEHGDLEVFQFISTGEDFNLSFYVNAPSFMVQNWSLIQT